MTSILVRQAEVYGDVIGWCSECGSRAMFHQRAVGRIGARVLHHVKSNGAAIDIKSVYRWFHNPQKLIHNGLRAALLRARWAVMMAWRIPVFKIQLELRRRRIPPWPDER